MPPVRRYDAITTDLAKAERLPNGFLRAPATLTRTGVFEYRLDDGSIRRELRLPDEVFKADALASFALVPLTDDHPKAGLVTAENAHELMVGYVGENVRQDGDVMRATVLITDADVVEKVEAGKRQLSCGYTCELEKKTGEWNGERYDAVQRNIRGNHLAIVDVARAGPVATLKLDSGDGVSIRGPRPQDPGPGDDRGRKETEPMVKITIDGIEIEVANDQASQLIARALKTREDARTAAEQATAAARAELDKANGRADALDAKVKDLEKTRADAADPKRVSALVKARVALETKAREVLGEETKLDELDEQGVKKAVLAKLTPGVNLDGKSVEYVDARFDAALEAASQGALAGARRAADDPERHDTEDRQDADQVRAKFVKDTEAAFRKPSVGLSRE